MLVDTQKLVAPEGFWLKLKSSTHGPLLSMMNRGLNTVFLVTPIRC